MHCSKAKIRRMDEHQTICVLSGMCVMNETHCVLKRMDERILCSKDEKSEHDGVFDVELKTEIQRNRMQKVARNVIT